MQRPKLWLNNMISMIVQLELGFLSHERIAKYVNEALACACCRSTRTRSATSQWKRLRRQRLCLLSSDSGVGS